MLVAFWAFNNITAHTLLSSCREVPLKHYRHQTTNNFEKLLEQKNAKNTLKVAIPIFLTIRMHIGLTRLLKVGRPNVEYDLERKLHKRCINIDWGDNGKIKEAMAADDDKDNNEGDFWEKIGS